MSKVLNERLIYEILSVVEEIPPGRVATYGQIASLIGRENYARLVGKVMSLSDDYGSYPCHRVVNAQGRLVPGWGAQRSLLEGEGITFLKNGCVDVKQHLWDCD